MPNINKANRQVCDVDIRVLKTKAPYLFFEDANVTTVGFSSTDTYAMARGSRAIAFSNPIEDATMTIEAQVKPFKLLALISDGTIETSAILAKKSTITCDTEGTLTLPTGVQAGSVFVYAKGDYAGEAIEGTVAGTTFTATTPADVVMGEDYEVGYLVTVSSGVQKIAINDKKNPQDYFVTYNTVEKDEDGVITPYIITGYKCKPVKAATLSYSSTGDSASLTITFNCLKDKDGNLLDMVEYTEPETEA
ncbi:MAG: hypothetical protein WCR54_08890 [Clostridia bacterium]